MKTTVETVREDSPWHRAALSAVRRLAEGAAPRAIPWPSVHEFLAVVTHPRIFKPPTPIGDALHVKDAGLDRAEDREIPDFARLTVAFTLTLLWRGKADRR